MPEKNSTFRQQGNELIYTRLLNAPRDLVWEVWTEPKHLKEWWATDILHGFGQKFDNNIEYLEMVKPSSLSYKDGDENDSLNFTVHVTFQELGTQTLLTIHSVFESAEVIAQLNKEALAEQGRKQTLDLLEHYINTQFKLRQQLKTTTMARVSTYLNFNRKTEEAFLFYKSVFGGEFGGDGVTRLGTAPAHEGMPELSEEDKNLILFIQLPILGGHMLMGTDAPESMGFTLTNGDNMHIMLEPDTREETKRLFEAISAGGKVTMELKDMFFGAYYGSCTDKFGVQWMVNHQNK